jgi:hypothetical protein
MLHRDTHKLVTLLATVSFHRLGNELANRLYRLRESAAVVDRVGANLGGPAFSAVVKPISSNTRSFARQTVKLAFPE